MTITTVERYRVCYSHPDGGEATLITHPEGEFVAYQDYAALSVPAAAVVGETERRATFDAGWDMHALLSATPPAQGGWQPMETASKDGTEYLLITKDDRQYVGRFRLGSFGEPQLHEIAWRCSSSGRFSTPVAWRPLPAPPVLGEKP